MKIENWFARVLMGATVAAGCLVSPLLSRPAQACGGFWCSLASPVNQAAERIIFVDHEDDTVTAVIQISYVGPSEKFAWVIPIPGKPKIAVSSNTALDNLDLATAPQYTLEQKIEGMCKQDFRGGLDDFAPSATAGAAQDAGVNAEKGVSLVDSGSVGPYDYDVIEVDAALPKPADAAIKWFGDHGYDLTGVDADLLGPYLADGLHLLAFKLTKSSTAGSIRPVMLTYDSKLPMIPIRPTAVAAQDDMGILVWVAARDQAVPQNYKSLVINDALINWFSYQSNYRSVVTAAANEAGGQGFVTELAGSGDPYKEAVFPKRLAEGLAMLKSQTFADGIDALILANNYYRGFDGWRDAIMAATTLPPGVTFDQFGRSSPEMYRGQAKVDVAKFIAAIETNVVKPVSDTQDLINTRPYLTRLFSTMSSEEMTVDPAFTYNTDLANVSNKHVAKMFVQCSPELSLYEAPWRIELPQGGVIRGKGQGGWPIEEGELPANLKIVQLSTKGPGTVVTDNSGMIGTMLFETTGMKPVAPAMPAKPATGSGGGTGVMIGGEQKVTMDESATSPTTGPKTRVNGGGCAIAGTPSFGSDSRSPFAVFALFWSAALCGLLGVRMRRRAR